MTETQFEALLDLIRAVVRRQIAGSDHPNDVPRMRAADADLETEIELARIQLVDPNEGL